MKLCSGILTTLIVLVIGTSVPAEIIVNGDFEDTPFDTAWSNTGAILGPGLGGSPQSATIRRGAELLQQVPDAMGLDGTLYSIIATYTINFNTLVNDESRVRIQGSIGGGNRHIISSRWSATGMDIFDGGSWFNAISAAELGGSLQMDTDYIVTFAFDAGDGMGGASPEYDLTVAWDMGSVVKEGLMLTHHGLPSNLASFQGPVTGIKFRGGSHNLFSVDDISIRAVQVPEPSTLALLGMAITSLAVGRRRRRQPLN